MESSINPNRDRTWIREYVTASDAEKAKRYPLFFSGIKFDVFRHLRNIDLDISSPITVISGSNKSGKTTALMAIACSHHNFQRRRTSNGDLERNTWGDVMRFTDHDEQIEDWIYHVSFRKGTEVFRKQGSRNHLSKKWSGVAKKQGQIDTPKGGNNQAGRQVTFIDLERLQPARHLSPTVFNKAKSAPLTDVDIRVAEYLSYILESEYQLKEICSFADNVIYKFDNGGRYSSYNCASGEDVLTRLIRDIVDSPEKSLILIEEIEVGLHPKIQRRLMQVLMHESRQSKKQFIVTTHSPTILSSVDADSRLFIDASQHRCIKKISANAALSKMDAISFPLMNLLVEDDLAKWIVMRAISEVNTSIQGFSHLVNVIVCGSAAKTYSDYCFLRDHHEDLRPKCGFACVLDGDQRVFYRDKVTPQDSIFFLYESVAPEVFLVRAYLKNNPNPMIEYHLSSDPHCLFGKMCEASLCVDSNEAIELCWDCFISTPEGEQFFAGLKQFLIDSCKKFSPEL